MTVKGRVKNGKVLLDDPKALPNGTEVVVRAVKKPKKVKPAAAKAKPKPKPKPRSLADRLRPVIGIVKGLPPDMSINLDHYLYGHPKR